MPAVHAAAAATGRRGLDALRRSPLLNPRLATRTHSTNAAAGAGASRFVVGHSDADGSLTHRVAPMNVQLQRTAGLRNLSSSPASQPGRITTDLTVDEEDQDSKSIFSKLWDKYSFEGQQKRIILGERLFRAAQHRANDPRWFTEARIPYEFRPRHALLTMHVWFLHKRLLADRVDSHLALLVQEELFDILWNDTRARIRAEGVHELTVNKHLKDAQQLTFLQCTHYDHSFEEFAEDDKKRFEEISGVNWMYVLNKDEEAYKGVVNRLSVYVEYQLDNLLFGVPDEYFWEGRIPWGDVPDFVNLKDNDGKDLKEMKTSIVPEEVPKPWLRTLTDAGAPYYWNPETGESSWKKQI